MLGSAARYSEIGRVAATDMPLGLVPEVLDAIDMVVRISEEFRMIDPVMMELGDIQHIIKPEAVSVDDAVRADALSHNPHQSQWLGIRDHDSVNLAASLEQFEHRHLPGSPSATLALACTAKTALVHLNFTIKERCFFGQPARDHFAQLVEKQDRRVAIHTRQLGRSPATNCRISSR
jgi:hypothetical protein